MNRHDRSAVVVSGLIAAMNLVLPPAMKAADCNGNGVPDEQDSGLPYVAESGRLSPFGAAHYQVFSLVHPPMAGSDVVLTLEAVADLGQSSPPCQAELAWVFLEDLYVGTVFQTGAHDCPAVPDVAVITLPAAEFNSILKGGHLNILVAASGNVDDGQCGAGSYVAVRVAYNRLADCNANGTLDECDLLGGASPDINRNRVPDECDPDCNRNGVPDDLDVQATGADCNLNGIPDECEADADGDGRIDDCDNCRAVSNPGQEDADQDRVGNACDNCPGRYNPDQCDLDGDGTGDDCDLVPPVTTALAFNGYSSVAVLPDVPGFHFGRGDFTVELWFQARDSGILLDSRVDVAPGESGYCLAVQAGGQVAFSVEMPEQQHAETSVWSPVQVRDGSWHHVAAVRSGASIMIYVDGALQATAALVVDVNLIHGGNLVLGARHTVENFFVGSLDEIRLWNVARGADQIAGDMHRSMRGNEVGLVGYWGLHGTCHEQRIIASGNSALHGWLGLDPLGPDPADPVWLLSDAPLLPPPDSDGDGAADPLDNCPNRPGTDPVDTDGDYVGESCDNCPAVVNRDQADLDGDGLGDLCDDDDDGDHVPDVADNCPREANAGQADRDGDRVGDCCDACPDDLPG